MRLTQKLFAVFALSLSVFSSACEDLPESAIRGYRATFAPNKAADRMQGAWSTACTAGTPSSKTTLLIFGRQLSVVTLWFSGGACESATQQYSLTVGKDFTLPDDENLDTQTLKTTVRLASMSVAQTFADEANAETLCGQSGWTDTSAVDVQGRTCKSVVVPAVGANPSDTLVFTGSGSLTFNGSTYEKDE